MSGHVLVVVKRFASDDYTTWGWLSIIYFNKEACNRICVCDWKDEVATMMIQLFLLEKPFYNNIEA